MHQRSALSRILIYLWTLPTTLVGLWLLPIALMTGGSVQFVDGVIEIYGGVVSLLLRRCTLLKGGASAMTLGHVVLGRDRFCIEASREHERVHVRQAERWGPLFIPAYLIGSVIAWLRGGNAYLDNPFEREAFSQSGG